MNTIRLSSSFTAALSLVPSLGQAQPTLIAVDSLTESRAGANADLSGLTYSLENQAPANLLGGLGSAITVRILTSFLYSALRMKICLAMSRPRMGCRSGTRRSRQLALRIRFDDEETHHRIGG